jgi:hypothetical protein
MNGDELKMSELSMAATRRRRRRRGLSTGPMTTWGERVRTIEPGAPVGFLHDLD